MEDKEIFERLRSEFIENPRLEVLLVVPKTFSTPDDISSRRRIRIYFDSSDKNHNGGDLTLGIGAVIFLRGTTNPTYTSISKLFEGKSAHVFVGTQEINQALELIRQFIPEENILLVAVEKLDGIVLKLESSLGKSQTSDELREISSALRDHLGSIKNIEADAQKWQSFLGKRSDLKASMELLSELLLKD